MRRRTGKSLQQRKSTVLRAKHMSISNDPSRMRPPDEFYTGYGLGAPTVTAAFNVFLAAKNCSSRLYQSGLSATSPAELKYV